MTKNVTTNEAKFTARFPDFIFQRISEKARANNRSINQELIHGMSQYLEGLDELELLIASVKNQLASIQSTEMVPA
ncbi:MULTISPECIES: Arc family DNA-binding protein [unclassified Pseudomonas]|uniref:Arc family DNA-binding protein n=1 Tax=unclassified Pseudomonas TaxID=196821 RepID=UPI001909F45C|nr:MULTISPECIES: Arc family DNA-binding protein [unclassified Pseudomonas]MBK3468476.1 Arc family DNA-binding protein [Pseudomonas sp. MF6776]